MGIVAAAALVRAMFGGRLALAAAIPVAAALLLAVYAVPSVWGGVRGFESARGGLESYPGVAEREKCLVDSGQDPAVGLSRWISGQTPSHARIAVKGRLPIVCLQLALLPRVIVADEESHDFTLYTGDIPHDVRALATSGAAPSYTEVDAVLVPER